MHPKIAAYLDREAIQSFVVGEQRLLQSLGARPGCSFLPGLFPLPNARFGARFRTTDTQSGGSVVVSEAYCLPLQFSAYAGMAIAPVAIEQESCSRGSYTMGW